MATRPRKKLTPNATVSVDPTVQLLEFIAGLLVSGGEASESDQLRVAKTVGLKAAQVARIFSKSAGAAQKALERTKVS